MHAHHAQHRLAVLGEAGNGPFVAGHLGRHAVGVPAHDRGERAGDGAALVGVVGDAAQHEQRAEVGVAEPERAVVVRVLARCAAVGYDEKSTRISCAMKKMRIAWR